MGGLSGLLEKMPLPGNVDPKAMAQGMDDKMLKRQVALINSMTPQERRFPKSIDGSRKRRIATGAGQAVPVATAAASRPLASGQGGRQPFRCR